MLLFPRDAFPFYYRVKDAGTIHNEFFFLKLNGFRVREIFVCGMAEHESTFQGFRIYPVIFKLGIILLFLK